MMRLRRGKFLRVGGCGHGQFGNDGAAVLCDLIEEGGVVVWVGCGEAGADGGERSALSAEGGLVCGGVDAACAAGDDGESRGGRGGGEAIGLLCAVGGGFARADDGEGERVVACDGAFDVEQGRGGRGCV